MTEKAAVKSDPKVFLATVNGGVTKTRYRKGQKIFAQGDPSDAVFFIEKGRVKVTVVSQQGKEAVIAFLETCDFVGEAALNGQPRRIATATAMADSVIARVEKSTMLETLRSQSAFSEMFTSYLLTRPFGWKRTWSISFSTPAKSGWRVHCSFWLTLERAADRWRSFRKSIRPRWLT